MSNERNEYDAAVVGAALLAFSLPLTLLVPGFSVWNVVPKVRVTRFHFINQQLTWSQLNAAIVAMLALFFCLFLEIRKRKLDEMVESVLLASQETDAAMEVERERQSAALRACVNLLDASVDHYENLVLLRDDLRKRDKSKQAPPEIEPSCSDM